MPKPCKNYAEIAVGAGGVVLGGAAAVGGFFEAVLGLAGSPESGGVSWLAVTNGAANEAVGAIAVRDGLNLIDTGLDGVQRSSTLGGIGYAIGGERGQQIGDMANIGLAVRDFGVNGVKNGLGSTPTNYLNTALSTIVPDSMKSCQTVY